MSNIDTGTQELLASKENGVGILTMNRPEEETLCPVK